VVVVAQADRHGREEAGFVDGPTPLYVAVHRPHPSRRPAGTAVVCSALGWEFTKNYRREVMLGRSLAQAGFVVVRFHYRGQGESGGRFTQLTVASMTADARQAFEAAGGRPGHDVPAVVGIRVGALAAASFSREFGGTPLIFWDPVVSGPDYLRELTRVGQVWNVVRGADHSAAGPPRADDGLEADGSLEVMGYRLGPELVRELGGACLEELIPPASSEVLSLHIGTIPRRMRESPRRGTGELKAEAIAGRTDWWLKRRTFEPEEHSALSCALVSRTTQWLTSLAVPASTRPAAPVRAVRPTARFGNGTRRSAVPVPTGHDTLAGVLVEPAAAGTSVACLLLNCGSYHLTSGPVGLWARLGDRLAQHGIPSLRVAYRGVADSTGEVNDFDLTRPGRGDLEAARALLTRRGFGQHLLIGACFGARTICAGRLDGVAGMGLVSLPLHVESLARPLSAARVVNQAAVEDLRRCVAAHVPIRVVYSRDEPYRSDFDAAAAAGDLKAAMCSAGSRFEVTLVDGRDSMFETSAVIEAVTEFAVDLLRPLTT
jgi:hypothetical protein